MDKSREREPLPENPLCRGDGKCDDICGGCLEETTGLEYRMAFEIRDLRAENTQLKAALADRERSLEEARRALLMHKEHHKRNWDPQETCHICNVTRVALAATQPAPETKP